MAVRLLIPHHHASPLLTPSPSTHHAEAKQAHLFAEFIQKFGAHRQRFFPGAQAQGAGFLVAGNCLGGFFVAALNQ
jgi:hypothetical protein